MGILVHACTRYACICELISVWVQCNVLQGIRVKRDFSLVIVVIDHFVPEVHDVELYIGSIDPQ